MPAGHVDVLRARTGTWSEPASQDDGGILVPEEREVLGYERTARKVRGAPVYRHVSEDKYLLLTKLQFGLFSVQNQNQSVRQIEGSEFYHCVVFVAQRAASRSGSGLRGKGRRGS